METTQSIPDKPQFVDFFWFSLELYEDGSLYGVRFEAWYLSKTMAQQIFTIYTAYYKYKSRLTNFQKDFEQKKKVYTEEMQRRTHRKHCYQRAIAEHQNTTNHLRRQIRAFEQLAKANEESRKELERNKRNWGFSIWAEK